MTHTVCQECPHCQGTIEADHHAIVKRDAYEEHLLYCDYCATGWELMICDDGKRYPIEYTRKYEPNLFNDFLKRLEAARAA